MPVVKKADAENITAACIDSSKNAQLDISRRVAFVSDNASVMIGKQKGLFVDSSEKRKKMDLQNGMCVSPLCSCSKRI